MPTAMPPLTGPTLEIRAWDDEIVDRLGHDPRSAYVERFWLGVLGPSTVWLLRRIATGLDARPDGFTLPLGDTARALGLGGDGVSSPFARALRRCCQFDMARADGPGTLAVRRHLPPLARRHLLRLPESVQAEHADWEADTRRTTRTADLDRARQLAASLLELGEDPHATEHQLLRWRFDPTIARDATTWAADPGHDGPLTAA
ncbi:MAG: hypothetical protein AB7H43_15855 [Acidimicrobiia bacterium]